MEEHQILFADQTSYLSDTGEYEEIEATQTAQSNIAKKKKKIALGHMQQIQNMALHNIVCDSQEDQTRRTICRNREVGHDRLIADYFGEASVYKDYHFQ